MKTISIQDEIMAQFNGSQAFSGGACGMAIHLRGAAAGRAEKIPTWLPAPPVTRPMAAPKTKATRAGQGIWIHLEQESAWEKVFLVMLILAAVIGVGYGFSYMVDFVQNWAGVNLAVGQLVQ